MFGLEKKPQAVFEMDLERDLKKDPGKAQEMLKTTEKKILEIKQILLSSIIHIFRLLPSPDRSLKRVFWLMALIKMNLVLLASLQPEPK